MALFDAFAIVDWSAANTPTTGKDSIWIALGEREDGAFRLIETVNPPTRSAAMARLRQFFRDALAADKRVFAGFDLPFGYPRGAAGAIAGADDWSALWSFFADSVQDTDSNTNNRFEIAGRLNRDRLAFAPMFWDVPQRLPMMRPCSGAARNFRTSPACRHAGPNPIQTRCLSGACRKSGRERPSRSGRCIMSAASAARP